MMHCCRRILRKSDAVCWSYANASVYLCNRDVIDIQNINNSAKK